MNISKESVRFILIPKTENAHKIRLSSPHNALNALQTNLFREYFVFRYTTNADRKRRLIRAEEIKNDIFTRQKIISYTWYYHILWRFSSSHGNSKLNFRSQMLSNLSVYSIYVWHGRCDVVRHGMAWHDMHLVVYRFLSTVKSTIVFLLCARPALQHILFIYSVSIWQISSVSIKHMRRLVPQTKRLEFELWAQIRNAFGPIWIFKLKMVPILIIYFFVV